MHWRERLPVSMTASAPTAGMTIDELVVADAPESWDAAGFDVDGDVCRIGTIAIRLAGTDAGRGLIGWSLRGLEADDLDGLPTVTSTRPVAPPAGKHPNGVVAVDHVVAFSPDLDRTVAALTDAGLDLRRIREEPTPAGAPRQAFFRLGEAILEVIQLPGDRIPDFDRTRSARLWGLAFQVEDLDACVASLGERVGAPRDAVQPGRRIATLRKDAGITPPVAFMTPAPKA